ncbi:AMP-binding protein, partial [Ruminococcaceae bacterium OttesenSCG-928-D13]|nr:AMP-binding protein [Ruminococcaceae bacterium OttesenSCG-928-D13]
AKDLVYRNNAARVKAILAVDDPEILAEVEESPTVAHFIKLGPDKLPGWLPGWRNYDEETASQPTGGDLPRVSQNEDVMLLYFTSGTTGPPKMVAHNQLYPLGHIATARFWQNLHPASLHLTVADSGWAKAVWGKIFGQWLCEAAVFVYDHDYFDVKKLLEVVSRHRVTSFCAPPTIYRYLIRADLDAYDLSALEWATTAGEALNPEISRRFKDKTGIDIREGYGQTETTPMLLTTPYMAPRYGYLGRPNPTCTVLLLDADNRPVPDGEVGEICIQAQPGRTPGLFIGYYEDPQRTAAVWAGGIYHTGDLAIRAEDGCFQFVGRDDDVIKASSYRIGPFEVESVLMEHPAVVECAVTGVPDAQRGQAVKASIILAPEYTGSPALARELQQFVKDNTAPYKCPRIVDFVEELPKTISGKIRRVEIRGQSS